MRSLEIRPRAIAGDFRPSVGCQTPYARIPNRHTMCRWVRIYRDRNLGEPALAALIQDDISANPEDPHKNAHGTFSFDVANGTCGVLTDCRSWTAS
jgi:hypothetical protein